MKDKIGYTPVQYATIELAERMGNAGWDEAAGISEAGQAVDEARVQVAGGPEGGPKRSCVIA